MMAADETRATEPVTFAGGVLDRYRHVCVFANERPEEDAVFDEFIAQGIDRGDRLLYLVDPDDSAAPVNRLRRLGYDAATLLERHRAEVRTWADTYLRGGAFDQHAMLDLIGQVLGSASPRIRMLCDMGWAAEQPGVADELIEFEARANFLHAKHEHVVVCAYDSSKFDGSFVVDVLRTHPMVVIGGILQINPFFIPPSEFLAERGLAAAG